MEQQKLQEALNLSVFLRSLQTLTESSDDSDDEGDDEFPSYLDAIPVPQPISYSFELDPPRKWIKDLLLEDSSESEEEESIDEMLSIHRKMLSFREQYHADPLLAKYMYYSSDCLTGDNKWPSHCQAVKKRCAKRKVQLSKQGKVKRSSNQDSPASGGRASRTYPPRSKLHGLNDKISHGNLVKKRALSLSRKRSMNIAALRRYIWKIIAKKEIPKAYRQHVQNQSSKLAMLKKASKEASKKVRARAHESRLRAKREVVIARARRMTREAQLFWKKYVRVEKTQRRHAEKQALTQRKIEDEKREAHKQQEKLEFLITQTEIYAQIVSGKSVEEVSKVESKSIKEVATQSAEKEGPGADVEESTKDANYSKERAYQTANAAFLLHQSKMKMFSNAEGLFKGEVQGEPSSSESTQPNLLQGQLTGYQQTGVDWLFNLHRHGLNGILADDMGLGKTVQTIAFLAGLAERYNVWGPFLVIAPASTLNNWHQEFSKFLPAFKVLPYWGTTSERKVLRLFWNKKSDEANTGSDALFHVLITSYQLATTDMRYFQKIPWHYIVFDEAHALKSSNSIRWRTLLNFNCRNRLLLTGTPVQNTMAELWALLHFIMPTLFDDYVEFNEWFAKNIENYVGSRSTIDESDLSRLHRILKPFILRRLKCDVEHELTEKVEVRVLCQLSPRQKVLYEALQKNMLVKELIRARTCSAQSNNNIVLMNLVMQFRKVCNHPNIFHSRDVHSPFITRPPTYTLPRLIFNSFVSSISSPTNSSKLFYSDLNVHTPKNVHRCLHDSPLDSTFSFLRFCNMSLNEYWAIFAGKLNDRFRLQKAVQERRRKETHRLLFHTNSQLPYAIQTRATPKLSEEVRTPDTSPIVSFHLPTFIDLYDYTTPAESTLSGFFFASYRSATSHLNHTITCLTRHGSTSSLRATAKMSPVKKSSPAALHRHRTVATIRTCVATDLPSAFFNLYLPKVCCHNRAVHCDDVGALRQLKTIDSCLKGTFPTATDLPRTSIILVPDREQVVTDSGKLFALDMLLRRLKDGGHRVLVYSQMTKMIDILEEYMLMRGHMYVRLDGSSRISSRRDTVAGFQTRDEIFVFLLSTRAGGIGINLTAADTVIFYDSDWNPTVDQQAMDRAHRLGQTKQVTVYRLVCKGTVDERILARAEAKSTIQRMVIQDGGFKNDPLDRNEMVNLLLDDDHLAVASQNDDALKSSLEIAKTTGKRKYRRKANTTGTAGKTRSKRAKVDEAHPSNVTVQSESLETINVTHASDASGSTDDQVVVVDDDNFANIPPPSSSTAVTRGQRKRGRPRLRPIAATKTRLISRAPAQRKWQDASKRGRGGGRVRRRGRSFSGRAAAMAGARAGALAASMQSSFNPSSS